MPNWVTAIELNKLKDFEPQSIELYGKHIALLKRGETVIAFDDTCTHADASLCDGTLDGDEIECPLHFARFNVLTGTVLCGPATECIKTYETRVVEGIVQISI